MKTLTLKKLLTITLLSISITSITLAATGNTIRRGNLIIDLDTGQITIANDNAQYTSLIETGTTTTTGTIVSTGSNVNTGDSQSKPTTTGSTNTTSNTGTIVNTGNTININTSLSEIEQAIAWWFNNKLTIYDTVSRFKVDNAITRQEAAKFLFQASLLLGNNEIQNDINCNFSDKSQIHVGLQEAVQQACAIGLMRGDKWTFKPLKILSRAEAVTIISRIAGYKESPINTLRRSPYYQFVKWLGILKTAQNESTMDYKISRWDLMILLYRLSNKLWWNTWSSNIIETNTSLDNEENQVSSSSVSLWAGISDDPEFMTALLWMNKAGMTKFWKPASYNPLATLTRGQASQFLSIYDQNFDDHSTLNNSGCIFTDNKENDFVNSIQYVCEKWILRGNNKLFRPNDTILKVEFIAWILNMLNEYPSQSTVNRSNDIFKKALSLDIIARADESTFDKPITRYEVALLLSKLYLKNEFTKSLSDSSANYNIISPLDNDQTVYTSWQQKVFIDVNSIDSREFTNWFITLFGNNYKLNKKQITQYFPTSYVWYGEIIDIDSDTSLWMISMSIGQKWISKLLIEWYIIMNNESWYYTIQSTDQVPYYIITKIK